MGVLADIVSPLASPVGGLVSGIIQNIGQKRQQQKAFENDKEMWNMANYYNSPEMQMQRLKDAGLNPNLVYGNGSVVGNTSTSTPHYQAPNLQRLPLEMFNPMDILGKFMDLKQKSAQVNLTNEMLVKQQIENRFLAPIRSTTIAKNVGSATQLHQQLGIDDSNWYYDESGGWKVDHIPIEKSPYKQKLQNELFLQGSQLAKYNAETDSTNMRTALMNFEKEFMQSVPKAFQWLAPFIFKMISR